MDQIGVASVVGLLALVVGGCVQTGARTQGASLSGFVGRSLVDFASATGMAPQDSGPDNGGRLFLAQGPARSALAPGGGFGAPAMPTDRTCRARIRAERGAGASWIIRDITQSGDCADRVRWAGA